MSSLHVLLLLVMLGWGWVSGCSGDRSAAVTAGDAPETWTLIRSGSNPLIHPDTDGVEAEWGYHDINGPSVIRAPSWVGKPLGRYYMYFAHHRGSYIRMAYADDLEGPWTVLAGGVLHLEDSPALDHVASPDIQVDEEKRIVRLLFHSVDDTTTWRQTTYMAVSTDGLDFDVDATAVGPPYLREFRIGEQRWAVAKVRGGPGGVLLRSNDVDGPLVEGPLFLEGMRHGAVARRGNAVDIVFSRIGDEPERLLATTIDPQRMWDDSYEPEVVELLAPEFEYEGASLPVASSEVGETVGPVHALRDPFVFVDATGERYLFYAVAGEYGIAMARILVEE